MLTEPEARARLASMVASSEEPALSQADLDDILRLARIRDRDGNPPDAYTPWRSGTAYRVGDRVVPSTRNAHVYEVSAIANAGQTSSTEPTWPLTGGGTVVDGQVTWREAGAALWAGRWNLRLAASEGWNRKAAKCANYFSKEGGARDQIFEHCLKMAARYAPLVAVTVGPRPQTEVLT